MSSTPSPKSQKMTEGNITKLLITFALPLFVGNLFQQFYNTVDSIVVGNFVSKTALAAVGSTDCIINTIIGFFTGLSTGAGVVIAHSFGSGNDKALHRAVHTTIALTLVLSVVFTIAGLLLSPVFLQLMDTPEDVLPEASQYLRIYFAGISGLMLYNMGSGILRAVGDSRRPLYILMVCALGNIFFDLLFVIVFHAGVEGVAYATILSQWISAILVLDPYAGKKLIQINLERPAYPQRNCHVYLPYWLSCRTSDRCYFFFQCICSVLYQPFRLLLHGWLDNLWKTG